MKSNILPTKPYGRLSPGLNGGDNVDEIGTQSSGPSLAGKSICSSISFPSEK